MHSTLLHHAATAERDRTLRHAERIGPLLDRTRSTRRRRRTTIAGASRNDRSGDQR